MDMIQNGLLLSKIQFAKYWSLLFYVETDFSEEKQVPINFCDPSLPPGAWSVPA